MKNYKDIYNPSESQSVVLGESGTTRRLYFLRLSKVEYEQFAKYAAAQGVSLNYSVENDMYCLSCEHKLYDAFEQEAGNMSQQWY